MSNKNVAEPLEYLCIGIDIGGTNTDAVLLAGKQIIAVTKVNTTPDVAQGVINAINNLFKQTTVLKEHIDAVVIGTTHFVNSVLQATGLNKVLIVRLAKPATTAIEPLVDWPANLREAVSGISEIIYGGYEYNGKEIAKLDVEKLTTLGQLAQAKAIPAAAITGVFSHVNPAQEKTAYKILKSVYPEMHVTLSHLVGGLNLLLRENAAIINAALTEQFKTFYNSIKNAITDLALAKTSLFFSCNDGTMENPHEIFPITTYGSGTSNSMRGAAVLAGLSAAIVADIGGTSTDVGILKNGFPLEAGYAVQIGNETAGVACNFSSPLTRSCGLGGGSIVAEKLDTVQVGPASVAYKLESEAIIFGGKTLTLTDIAVAKGRLQLGNPQLLTTIKPALINKADEFMHAKLAEMINLLLPFAKSNKLMPLILVGGGANLFDQQKLLELLAGKVKSILIPPYAGYANALGAAVAKVSGNFNGVFQYTETDDSIFTPRTQALAIARESAIKNAIEKGADPASVKIQELVEIPINYLPGNQTQLSLKVIGERSRLKISKRIS